MKCKYYQQGDVLLKLIDKLPDGLIQSPEGLILQRGETTGHKHQFQSGGDVQVMCTPNAKFNTDTITPNEMKYAIVGNMIQLLHEEHKPITIDPGIYEIDIVREFDYEKHEVRRVVD